MGKLGTSVENIIPAKCWACTRRYFTDDYEFNSTEDAEAVIMMISELYQVEKVVREKNHHLNDKLIVGNNPSRYLIA
ncbi:transposase [uncultured Sulfitobacter sp.]|uniref:IS66 family transposase n=1 Tax=uncultured Sulfitobacter sp. TaxID=191468 RepID=UPI0034513594